jgi:hypothetical protein
MKNPASTFWTVSKDGICSVHMHPGQKATWNSTRRFVFMISGTQGGKALDADTPIPTPTGFRKISELSVGDSVFGSDGKSAGVTFHSGLMLNHRCYRVSFDDGTSIIADAEHLWAVQTYKQRKNERRHGVTPRAIRRSKFRIPTSSVVTTEVMAGSILDKCGHSNYSIALPSTIEYPIANLLIPPYTFGAWLGDGTSRSPFITSADSDVVQQIRNEGIWIERDAAQSKTTGKASSYRIGKPNPRGGNDRTKSPVFLELAQLSVLSNKHIPDCYLTASKEQRLELLRGLMDTDGYATDHGRVEFDSTNKRLADGVAEIVRSLGVKARISTGRATLYGRDCGEKYTVTFFPNFTVFYVKRKAARQYNPTRPDVNNLYVVGIEEVESRPVCCIAVSAYNSLYVAGREYILTHNTCMGPWWLNREIDRMGSGDYLAITTSYDLFKLKMLPEMKTVFERLLRRGRYWPGDKIIELKDPETGQFWAKRSQDEMWGRIILRSTQSEGGLESATAKAAWLDEVGQDEFSLQNWEAVLRRLSIYEGRALGSTTIYNCYDEQTEIYTQFGWKKFGELTELDKVYACDEYGNGNFEKPGHIIWDRYKGPMVHLKSHALDLLVTPNHRIQYFNNKYSKVTTAEEFVTLKYRSLPIPKRIRPMWLNVDYFVLPSVKIGHKNGDTDSRRVSIPMSDWCAFFGWFLSEGSVQGSQGGSTANGKYRVTISQNDGIKKDKIRQDLSKLPFLWCEDKIGFSTSDKQLWSYLSRFGDSSKKFIPREIKLSGYDNLRILIDRMILGDGSYANHQYGQYIYYTVSPQLAEDFAEISMLAGVSTKRGLQPQNAININGKVIKSKQVLYRVGERRRARTVVKSHEIIDYDGHIGCATVSTGLMLVRRNGEEAICGNTGWLKSEVFDKWKGGDKDFDVIQFDSTMNPSFPKNEFERARGSLPEWRFNMFYRGQFAKPAGLIYADFMDYMVIQPFSIPPIWDRVVGVDFGGANTCLLWFALNPNDGRWYLYDEYLQGGKSTREHAGYVVSRPEDLDETVYVGGSLGEKQARIDWAEGGIRIAAPPFDNVEAGIDKVTEAIKTDKLRVFSTIKGWRDEVGTYRRETDADGQTTEKIQQKRKYHRMDATRYAFSHILGRGGVDIIGLGSYPGLGGL